MRQIPKTVFLSYRRRASQWAARAIYQNLTQHGFDVFLDYEGIAAGAFERIIIANIKARAHFLVLLTPFSLKGIEKTEDWLRREIETALRTKRNVVPLMLDGFDFSAPAIGKYLIGPLAALREYNALAVPPDFFDAAMERLRNEHLNTAPDAVPHPVSRVARQAAKRQQKQADAAPTVRRNQIAAEQWFERGFAAQDINEELRCYTKALQLDPKHALAYYNRALVFESKGNASAALRDYSKAIRLDRSDVDAYINRAMLRAERGNLAGGLEDLDQAVHLAPRDADAYFNRAELRLRKGAIAFALKDYAAAIRHAPKDADIYVNRGIAYELNGDLARALRDYDTAVRFRPKDADAYYNRARVRARQGDVKRALLDYGKAIRLQPKYAEAYFNRALIHADIGDNSAAVADYVQYLRLGRHIREPERTAIKRIIDSLRTR